MSKKLRGGLIGCGYASGYQLEGWAGIEEAEIVALSSRNQNRVDQKAKEFGIPSAYTDYRTMMDMEQLDFVDIATPPEVHLEMIQEAANRKLHVLCQKPIAPSLGELQKMMNICDEASVRFMVNENGRFQPWFRQMKNFLDADAIGKPFSCIFNSRGRGSLGSNPFSSQPFFKFMPRLIIYELGVHYLDTIRYLFGEVSSVYAHLKQISQNIKGEEFANLLLKVNDVSALIEMSWASVPSRKIKNIVSWGDFQIEGTRGTLHLREDGILRLITDKEEKRISFPGNSEMLGYRGAQQHFVDCLISGNDFETNGPETLKTMELVFGAYHSAENDRIYRVGRDINRLT